MITNFESDIDSINEKCITEHDLQAFVKCQEEEKRREDKTDQVANSFQVSFENRLNQIMMMRRKQTE